MDGLDETTLSASGESAQIDKADVRFFLFFRRFASSGIPRKQNVGWVLHDLIV